ncbi:MAG: glycosyltransferase family A protein [Bifidobacteriaceae bacterium]|nr:glycosyltransferase family A protein [Bifidobacteriaceae bacterium]
MARFSFVVIAYNVEPYIRQCLESVMAQTVHDIEIVVVDDRSTDNTASIIADTISGDERCSLIRHDDNQGAHLARKTGVAHTHGSHVIFVDGDDRVEPDLCERLEDAYRHDSPDILRFGRKIISPGMPSESLHRLEASFNQDTGRREGSDILLSVFSDTYEPRGTWSLIDCSFDGGMLRRAFSKMTDRQLGRMQDSYEFFVVADEAASMQVLPGYTGLLYSYGTGLSGDGMQSLERFESGQRGIHGSLKAILDYAEERDDDVVSQCARWMRRTVLSIVGRDWSGRLSMADQVASFPALRDTWGDTETAYIVAEPLCARGEFIWKDGGYPKDEDPCVQWRLLFNSLSVTDDDDPLVTEKIRHCGSLCRAIEFREDVDMRDDVAGWADPDRPAEAARKAARLGEIRQTMGQRSFVRRAASNRAVRGVAKTLFPQGSKRRKMLVKLLGVRKIAASGVWRGYGLKTLIAKGRSFLRR